MKMKSSPFEQHVYLNVNYLLDECGRCGERTRRIAEGEHHPFDLGAAMIHFYLIFQGKFRCYGQS